MKRVKYIFGISLLLFVLVFGVVFFFDNFNVYQMHGSASITHILDSDFLRNDMEVVDGFSTKDNSKEVVNGSFQEEIIVDDTSNDTVQSDTSWDGSLEAVTVSLVEPPTDNIQSSSSEVSLILPSNDIDTIRHDTSTLGTLGRLFIPSVSMDVALYQTDISSEEAQVIVDQQDSAAYFNMYSKNVIADHNHQGFHKIIDTSYNDKAYIKQIDGTIQIYRMIQKLEGINALSDLTDLDGNSVFLGSGNLIMYTCYRTHEYDNHVMIVVWKLEN